MSTSCQGELLLLSHQYKRAAEVLQEVLETSADEWGVFLQFLDACLEKPFDGAVSVSYDKEIRNLGSSSGCLQKEEAEKRLQDASAFIEMLQSKDHGELRRGPFLGSIEIEKRRFLLKLQGENVTQNNHCFANSLKSSIVDYFKRFGHMVSFVSDIQDYLQFIQRHDCTNLVDLLHEAFNKGEDENPVNLMRRKVSLHQVEMKLGFKAAASDKDVVAYAKDIVKLYVEGLKLSKDLDPQENLHGEELLTIAVTLLIELFCRTKHPGYVGEAILLLEFGLAVRRFSFPYKLMLINLYSTLLCVSAAFDWYKTLDAKNILVETLSHHILPSLIKSTLWSELDSLMKDMIKFYDDYLKEAGDLAILAYRHCNYSKVLEFVQFKERIQHSHNLATVKAEGHILRLKQQGDNPEEVMKVLESINYGREALDWVTEENLKALSFNDDLETRPWWSPAPGESFLTSTFERPLNWQQKATEKQCLQRKEVWCTTLQRRCLLPRLIHLSLGVVTLVKLEEDRETLTKTDMTELKHLVENFGMHLGLSWEKLEGVFSDLSSCKLHLRDLNVEASDLFSLALFWTAYQIASQPSNLAISNNNLVQYPGFLNDLVKSFLAELTNSVQSSDDMEPKSPHVDVVASWSAFPSLVSLTTESFAWYSLFLQTWLKSLQPTGKIGKKKKKGTVPVEQQNGSANGDRPTLLDALTTCTRIFCTELEGLISWLTVLLEIPEATKLEAYLEFFGRGRQSEAAVEADVTPVPGLVIHVLESTANESDEYGQRIGSVIQTWNPDLVMKNMLSCQRASLGDLKDLLTLRLKTLQAHKL